MIALPLIDKLDARHKLHLVRDYRNAPALRPGDFAVIDQSDTEGEDGALYLVGETEPAVWQYELTFDQRIVGGGAWAIWLRPLNRPSDADETREWFLAGKGEAALSEGPLRPEAWSRRCHGRVIGLFMSEFDETLLFSIGHGRA